MFLSVFMVIDCDVKLHYRWIAFWNIVQNQSRFWQ